MNDYRSFTVEKAKCAIQDFLELYKEYSVIQYPISEYELVIAVEDTAIFYIKLDYQCEFMDIEENRNIYIKNGVCGLDIEELTKNNILPKYNHSKFISEFEEKHQSYGTFIRYGRFIGVNSYYLANGMISHVQYIDKLLPELELYKRLDAWEGEMYHLIVYEMEAADGSISRAIDAIKGNVHTHILKIADRLLKQPYDVSRTIGFGLADIYHISEDGFIDAYQSYRNERKIKRLQEHFKYFTIESKYFRDMTDINPRLQELIVKIQNGEFDYIERMPYIKPEYKWKSEELVYKIIKKKYKNQGVIYQHRPFFLKSSFGGQMSYDVYISALKIAIEYQGKQHFEPIDFFGGIEAFEKLKKRDKEKAVLSKMNGVKLVYVNYWEDITPEVICGKINDMQHGCYNNEEKL